MAQAALKAQPSKNNLNQLALPAQNLTGNVDKIGEVEKDELQSALDSDDMALTKLAFDKLTGAYQAAGASVYAQAGNAEAGAAPDAGGSDYAGYDAPSDGAVEGEVVEGEVTDKK